MKECKKCGNGFEPRKGFVNYCSIKCRNGREWSEEDKEKKRKTMLNSHDFEVGLVKRKLNKLTRELPDNDIEKALEYKNQLRKEEILSADVDSLKYGRLRERILYEQNEKCNKCGLKDWLGEPITLELEHKDGDNKNNSRDNLEMLCPNCHSQTKTWRGRNTKGGRNKKVSDELLLQTLVDNNWNTHQTLLSLDLSPKGKNYQRCNIIIEAYKNINS